MEEHKPWERWPGETARAFDAFVKYRDTPAKDRSIRKCVTAQYGKEISSKVRQWQKWSAEWRWQVRVKAWADEQDRLGREAQLAEIKAMNRRHASIGLSLQSKAAERLQSMPPSELTASDVVRYFSEAIKLERIARGEPDTIIRYDDKRHPDDFTDEELAAIAAGSGVMAASASSSAE